MKFNLEHLGYILMATLFILLAYAGYLSYQSIDWDVLKRMEAQKLILPTPLPTTPITSSSAIPTK